MYKILTSAPQYLALLLLYFLESNYLSLQPRVVFFFILKIDMIIVVGEHI